MTTVSDRIGEDPVSTVVPVPASTITLLNGCVSSRASEA